MNRQNPSRSLERNGTKNRSVLLFLSWILLCSLGMGGLVAYQYQPGEIGEISPRWPTQLDLNLAVEPGHFTLVMALHPQCSCSRSSLSELEKIQRYTAGKMRTILLFNMPESVSEQWLKSELWTRADRLVNSEKIIDHKGEIAERLGAKTSGFSLLYNAFGELQFAGGITASRGHEGNNVGREQVISTVLGEDFRNQQAETPVFGCPLDSL